MEPDSPVRDLLEAALLAATHAGATYADARVVETRRERVAVRNGRVVAIDDEVGLGIGVRALVDGAWGFSAVQAPDASLAAACAREAAVVARAAAVVNRGAVSLAPASVASGEWASQVAVDPARVALSERIDLLLAADAAARARTGIRVATAHVTVVHETVHLATTEGAATTQRFVRTGAGMTATATSANDAQVRSWPNSFGGQWMQGGWEVVEGVDLAGNAGRVAEEAVELLSADECPRGTRTLILDSSQLALQIHESCGHPAEVDRVLDHEANFAGGTFLAPDMLGVFRFGAPCVNVVADSIQPGSLAQFGWDDEGVAAQRWHLVRDGIFVGYLSARDTAAAARESASRGCARAASWNRIPLVRMVNVSLEPGSAGTLEDLIADTEDGVYMETNASWSIDDRRYNFQFGCERGWEIRDGRRVRLLRNPTYAGISPTFWGSCDAVCSASEYRLWGIVNCGKGQPGQLMHMSHGAAPARFRDVSVGVGYAS